MVGRQGCGKEAPLYSFNLEDPILENHLLRGIVQFLDPGDLHSNWRIPVTRVDRRSIQSRQFGC
jgi:hypothetical protein